MRDPLNWSLPLFRLFGVTVRMHVLFPLVTLAMILRAATQKDAIPGFWVEVAVVSLFLLIIVVLHEFGHCFGARWVEGDASEVLIWPLGGLAFVDVPHTPRAHFISTAAGPAVNVGLCLLSGAVLIACALVPPLNPLELVPQHVHNWRDGITYSNFKYEQSYYREGPDGTRIQVPPKDAASSREEKKTRPDSIPTCEARLPLWQLRLAQFFVLNWFLFLLNLLPAFPLDGGRLLQSVLWARGDYRQATATAVMAGYVTAVVFFVYALATNESLILGLSLFVFMECRRQQLLLEAGADEAQFGYDFSQGYTSLERDQPVQRVKRPNFFQRWLLRRSLRRAQQAQEQRESEERRMDELLDKVHREGKEALTAEERRFLERVSARYRQK